MLTPNVIQRALGVSLLLLVMSLVVSLIVLPLINKGLALHEEKESLLFRLQQYQRILANKDNVLASMDSVKQQHDEQNYFNSEATDALASAKMQETIKNAIVDAGGAVSSTQAMPIETKNDFNRVSVSVRMSGNSEILRQALYQIETATPFTVIDQIDIRPLRGRPNPKTHKIDPSNELNVSFQATSFMRKKAQ